MYLSSYALFLIGKESMLGLALSLVKISSKTVCGFSLAASKQINRQTNHIIVWKQVTEPESFNSK